MTLFVMDVIYFTALQKEISIFIICLTATVLVFLFVMFIKTSGKPYRSEFWRRRLRMLSTVAISWSLLKMGRGILGLFGEQFMYSIAQLERGSAKEFFLCLAYSLVYVFCDAIPVLLTLNGTVV